MGWLDETAQETTGRSITPKIPEIKFDEKDIEDFWFSGNNIAEDKFVCLIAGKDGTGKSPLALSYLTDEDIKAGKRVVVIDLDGGNIPLISKYHAERCERHGRKVFDVFTLRNPLSEKIVDGNILIDYKETFNKIQGIVKLLKDKKIRDKYNVKYVIFDGLSTALKHAEYQMRIEKNVDETGGIQLRYWLIRNKLFIETIESIKSLPISSFFISHEDFILKKDGENSSIKEKVNALVHQKIFCTKEKRLNKTLFKAKIEKSKYNIKKEGKEIVFGEVDSGEEGEYTFTPEKVLVGLI